MDTKAETIGLIADMLQQANARDVRFIYVLLSAMLGEEAAV